MYSSLSNLYIYIYCKRVLNFVIYFKYLSSEIFAGAAIKIPPLIAFSSESLTTIAVVTCMHACISNVLEVVACFCFQTFLSD